MTYRPPIAEQRFVLDHVVRIAELAEHERFAAATPDMVDAIIDGIGQLAQGEYAPLNRYGDTHNPKWSPTGVTMPVPKSWAQTRLTMAFAKYGFVGLVTHLARAGRIGPSSGSFTGAVSRR